MDTTITVETLIDFLMTEHERQTLTLAEVQRCIHLAHAIGYDEGKTQSHTVEYLRHQQILERIQRCPWTMHTE